MDFDSLLTGFSINPDIRGVSALDSTQMEFRFTPVEALELQEEYTVALSDETSSSLGYRLADEYRFCFTVSDDDIPPEITAACSEDNIFVLTDSVVNTGWEKDCKVRLHFTEEIDRESGRSFSCCRTCGSL